MKTRIGLLAVIYSFNAQAATEQLVWGKSSQYTKSNASGLMQFHHVAAADNYQLKPVDPAEADTNKSDVRYQLYYKDIPIWGHELIVHKGKNKEEYMTGVSVAGIENEIKDTKTKLSAETVEQKIVAATADAIVFKNTEKVIYLDTKQKAHLAYETTLILNSPERFITSPHYIIDANSGKTLKQWDQLNRNKIGQGLGGNVLPLPYRAGIFQHGNFYPGIASLGKFDVLLKEGRCYLENANMRVINVNETELNRSSFPILSFVEMFTKLPTFSYPCDEKSKYVNKNDGNSAPANHSFSVINDTMYFASVTFDMYKNFYGVEKPIGDDLPLRAYTHIKNLDNAFAIPLIKIKGMTIIHQQIVIGDGDTLFTAPAQGTVAHELSHNFTNLNSQLKYVDESGGINEAFSDMASIAMQDYLRTFYPWYWDGVDWAIGREATFGTEPIRYMDDPEKDGRSIGHMNKYYTGIDVHESSGIFNKAFYLLAHKPDWNVRQAFQVMVDANQKYWTSGTHFEAAACGVIQAAIDRKYGKASVIDAFAEVGIVCPLKL